MPTVRCPDFVIPIDTTPSNSLGPDQIRDAVALTIQSPATLTGTITVQVSFDNTTFVPLTVEGTTALTIAASTGLLIEAVAFKYIRVNSGSNEAAARTYSNILKSN